MRGHRRRGLSAALWGLLVLAALGQHAGAVQSTEAPAGGTDAVYVAGNPDRYPIEFYDRAERRYAGILPALLERVEEKTGLRFIYIRSGGADLRERLARNGQVQLVSGCAPDELAALAGTRHTPVVFSLTLDGRREEACFVFTAIAGEELARTVEAALEELTARELGELALNAVLSSPRPSYPRWLLPLLAVAAALPLPVCVVLARKLHRSRRSALGADELDPVTGLGNKAYFLYRFRRDIPEQYRTLYCAAFIGFDLAQASHYYGDAEAEEQLHFAARELGAHASGREIAARVSEGGFALLRSCGGEKEAEKWAAALLAGLNRYTEKYEGGYRPDFHAGFYLLQPSDSSGETVLLSAHQGYQKAVQEKRPYCFVAAEAARQDGETLERKKQILEAIRNRQFQMYLQFIVRGDGGVAGAEALSRWAHPRWGLLAPGSYLGVMGQEHILAELDFYIFQQACAQLERWQRQGRDLRIACNFARPTIGLGNFVSRIEQIAEQHLFSRAKLLIEVAADAMEEGRETVFANISRCKGLGFRVALDNVGHGYLSFSDLRDYPVDIVILDRAVLTAAVEPRGAVLLRGLIGLIHGMGMEALCVGVETADQAELLRRLGCDYMQGHYFYRALPQEEADRLLP